MSKNKDNDELLRAQINDIIEADIQLGINDYLEEKEKKKDSGVGFSDPDAGADKLNVRVSRDEVDKILKEYKRIKKAEKSNLGEVKKLGLTDQFGRQL
tara:strand:+ start:371 stop:664 length:294 start_codon:yes stop_codon:yes gene_type:complete